MNGKATWWTIGAIGEPGDRVFMMQFELGTATYCVGIEKGQAAWIASQVQAILSATGGRPIEISPEARPTSLRTDLEPIFRVGELTISFADGGLSVEVTELPEDENREPVSVRFESSTIVAREAAIDALNAVIAGRPICIHCGESIDPDGHTCSAQNGHR